MFVFDQINSAEHYLTLCPVDADTWKSLQARSRRKSTPDILEDVYDGAQYKLHQDFLSIPCNVSLICNTDGVAIFRSSTTSLWPVWLAINELPKNERY